MKILITEKQLKLLIKEDKNIFVPRRMEDREERYRDIAIRKIRDYIKNESKGDLYLHNTPIQSLPDDLTYVGGDLFLHNTPITSLPDNLTVDGDLVLTSSLISSIPINLTVYGDLHLINTPLSKEYSDDNGIELSHRIESEGGNVHGDIIG